MTTSTEKLFIVVGTAVNTKGILKMRWGNDLSQRINILIKTKCEEINLHEMAEPLSKLQSAFWLKENTVLTPDQEFVVDEVIAIKSKVKKRVTVKETIMENVKTGVEENKKTDPRVQKFMEDSLTNMGNDTSESTDVEDRTPAKGKTEESV